MPTVLPSTETVMVLPLNFIARACQRPVPSPDVLPLARVRWLPLVLLLRMDHDPVSLMRK